MILKSADSKDEQTAALERLVTVAPVDRKAKIEQELRAVRAGLKAERDAAYLIDFDLQKSKNTMVIHDLRLEIGGRVAQIDHLLIKRDLTVYVLETKHFHAGVKITEDGEFLRWNDFKKTFEGMPSPLAQNERHIAVLKDAFKEIEMPTRLGIRLSPAFESFVLVAPSARIDRPKKFDTSRVVKADMLLEAIRKGIENEGTLDTIASMTRFVSAETIENIGKQLVALHEPVTFDFAAKFGIAEAETHKQVREPEATYVTPSATSENAQPKCRSCGSDKLLVQYGKYGYYFKCAACDGNTPVKVDCGKAGHKERIRKERLKFFRECAQCGTSSLYFTNPS